MKHASLVKELIEILIQQKKISSKEGHALEISFEQSNKDNFDDFLLQEGLIEREDLLDALSQLYQVPSFDAVGYFFDHHLLLMFPKPFLMSNHIIPIEHEDNIMVMCATNPADANLLPAIGEYVSYDIRFYVGIATDIDDAIEEFYDTALTEDTFDAEDEAERKMRVDETEREEDVEKLTNEDFDSNE